MNRAYLLILMSALFILGACSNSKQNTDNANNEDIVEVDEYKPINIIPDVVSDITLNDSIKNLLLIRGREIAIHTQKALQAELKKALREGTVNAMSFCNTRAMEITDSVSISEQVEIRRLAKKNRNPANAMNKNESNLFKSYILESFNSKILRSKVSWNDEGQPIFYSPIKTKALCLNCHGTVGKEVTQEVAERIAKLYPDDLAMDFKVGQLRGMWAITFPEYRVVDVERPNRQNQTGQ